MILCGQRNNKQVVAERHEQEGGIEHSQHQRAKQPEVKNKRQQMADEVRHYAFDSIGRRIQTNGGCIQLASKARDFPSVGGLVVLKLDAGIECGHMIIASAGYDMIRLDPVGMRVLIRQFQLEFADGILLFHEIDPILRPSIKAQ